MSRPAIRWHKGRENRSTGFSEAQSCSSQVGFWTARKPQPGPHASEGQSNPPKMPAKRSQSPPKRLMGAER